MPTPLEKILSRLQGVNRTGQNTYQALCPAHDDRNPSLTVTEADPGGKVLLKCHAGCEAREIMAAISLEMRDLFPHKNPAPHTEKKIVATYDYVGEGGRLLYQVVRYSPKAFKQRRPDGAGGWIWNIKGTKTVLYRLPDVLRAVKDNSTILVVEGEKDADNLRALGFVATCNPMGAGKWQEWFSDSLVSANVVIISDKDAAGRKHAQAVARSLHGKAARIRVLELPDRGGKAVKDPSDWVAAGGTKEELIALAKETPDWEPGNDPSPEEEAAQPLDLPEICASSQDFRTVTAQAWEALRLANLRSPSVFRRGGSAVRLEHDEKGNPVMVELNQDRMRYALARCANWYQVKRDEKIPAKPPVDVVRDVLATPDYPLPVLDRIVEVPVLAPSGEVCTVPGYQPEAKVYYEPAPGLSVPTVPDLPNQDDVSKARSLILNELLGDFPFVANADRANAVALLLLPFVRTMIDGPTPCHLVEAPTMGSGKTLLVEALLRPALGHSLSLITEAGDEDEWRKRLTAALRDGKPAVWVDNITRPLISGAFAAALTTTTWTDRVLGVSETATIPISCVWVVTGNNPVLSTEIARRSIRIRIDPKQDQPWLRNGFRHPELKTWVRESRGDLVWAALTLARAWVAAGKPKHPGRALGSYETWTSVLGGILANAGIPDFLGNLLEFYESSDHEGAKWRALVDLWWEHFKDQRVTTADLYPLVNEMGEFDLGRGDDRARKTSFGKQLMRQRDRVIGDKRIVQAGKYKRAQIWQLLPPDQSGPEMVARPVAMLDDAMVNVADLDSGSDNGGTAGAKEPF
jgi:putative DNA primase/helicase